MLEKAQIENLLNSAASASQAARTRSRITHKDIQHHRERIGATLQKEALSPQIGERLAALFVVWVNNGASIETVPDVAEQLYAVMFGQAPPPSRIAWIQEWQSTISSDPTGGQNAAP